MEGEETMAVEPIEWPFIKAQKEGGDPAVGGSNDHDDDVQAGNQYEIVVSNVVSADDLKNHEGLHLDDGSGASDGQFETCLISNADLAALNTTVPSDQIKIETFKVDDNVQYSLDPNETLGGSTSGLQTLITDPNDDQKLIRVYQTAMEDNDNKLITVYEIKPDMDTLTDELSANLSNSAAGKDVLVEIVPTPEEQLHLRSHEGHALSLEPPGNLQPLPPAPRPRRIMTNEELQAQLGQSVPLPPEELAAVTNSAAHTVSASSSSSLAELRCTLCGFVSYSRDEIASHCEEAHELFLCQACNLVFKKRASLQSHSRAKHNNQNLVSYHGGTTPKPKAVQTRIITPTPTFTPSPPTTVARKTAKSKKANEMKVISPFPSNKGPSPVKMPKLNISLAAPTAAVTTAASVASPVKNNLDLMPDIRDILAKNKAVLPCISTIQTDTLNRKKTNKTPATKVLVRSSSKDNSQALVLDSRLSDPQTRNQFNREFAKKITSTGVGGPELFGMPSERLPSIKGTYRLDIKERSAENGDITSGIPSVSNSVPSGGEPATNGREMLYSYDIVDTGIVSSTQEGCKVICGICSFANSRIENVLFHCEIDHKQYYCQNKRCQLGFSSWDSLMRHMKHIHRKEK